ncbi:RNA 2',3'-cyclic phosphodiesterase [Deinococcus cavernae]|uniref:RNA 2',3'-cyclic phosphodiesterase n=2 Tax=Deinococcus cavernae TaxID=2320857 RepID=A0A418VCP5_9DEIO|nr:RNA 2',3'-cyclic phosphodiesterase [Deinococcus cavernae]RJF73776.1 RNA 2',3'-cyclic phosphodiesterase [Deinococcus cavernae]
MAFIDRSVKAKPKGARPQTDEEHTPSTYRLFFALRVPTEIANRLAEMQRKLKGNWRAVNPGQMHITLTYLPAVPPEKIEDLKRLGTRLMQDLPPMQVKLRGTGYFPNEGSPRVWFVKVEAEGLAELAEQLRAGVQELGVQTDDLPFKAHVTLARKKGPAPRIPPLVLDHLEWTASSGSLYRSLLRKTGPLYEPQSTFRFRGTAPPGPQETPPPPQPETHPPKE